MAVPSRWISKFGPPGILCLLFSASPLNANTPSEPRVCFAEEKQALQAWIQDVQDCESLWTEYRGLQAKIRALYYEPIWKSRVDGSHPLEESIREGGQKRETYYVARLRTLENQSTEKANQILALLQKLQSRAHYFSKIADDAVLQDCFETALAPSQSILKDTLKSFSHIQETERDYHLAVKATSGHETGRYPEDTVERGGTHDDLYERFELERGAKRFEEDLAMMRFFEALRYFASEQFQTFRCCLKADQASYDQKLKTVRF